MCQKDTKTIMQVLKTVRGQFNPDGEQKAYLEHKKLYSADAIRALFTET